MEIFHMKSVLAASAVMALAGSSYGFTLLTIGQSAGSTGLNASSGSIVVAEVYDSSYASWSPTWSGDQLMVTGAPADWQNNRAAIMGSSWFGIDPKSPNSWSGGTSAANARPLWTNVAANNLAQGFTANLRIGTVVLTDGGDGDQLVSNVGTDFAGWGFAPQRLAGNVNGPAGNGAISTLNSGSGDATIDSVESVFIGHFTLTDPGAVLEGFINISLEGAGPNDGFDLNLNGEVQFGVGLYQVRNGNAIDVYVAEIPAPGALAAFGLAGLAGIRRRR
jgi:hypothetical protein